MDDRSDICHERQGADRKTRHQRPRVGLYPWNFRRYYYRRFIWIKTFEDRIGSGNLNNRIRRWTVGKSRQKGFVFLFFVFGKMWNCESWRPSFRCFLFGLLIFFFSIRFKNKKKGRNYNCFDIFF